MKLQQMFDSFYKAIVGTVTTDTETILKSVSDNSGTRLSELLKALQ